MESSFICCRNIHLIVYGHCLHRLNILFTFVWVCCFCVLCIESCLWYVILSRQGFSWLHSYILYCPLLCWRVSDFFSCCSCLGLFLVCNSCQFFDSVVPVALNAVFSRCVGFLIFLYWIGTDGVWRMHHICFHTIYLLLALLSSHIPYLNLSHFELHLCRVFLPPHCFYL